MLFGGTQKMCIRDSTRLNETLDSTSEGIKETLNKNKETVTQKIKEMEEEIENKEDKSVLFSENKGNNDTKKIKHIKTNSGRVKKNRIIKKNKKTEEMGKVYKKKLITTRVELEMVKNGLIEVFNLPITDRREIMKYKDCRRNLKEIIEGIHRKPMNKNLYNSLVKRKLPEIEMLNKKPIITCLLYTSRCV